MPVDTTPGTWNHCTQCAEAFGSLELLSLHVRVKHSKGISRHSKRLSRSFLAKLLPISRPLASALRGTTSHGDNDGSQGCGMGNSMSDTTRSAPYGQYGIYMHLLCLLAQVACERYDAPGSSRNLSIKEVCAESFTQLVSLEGKIGSYESLPHLLAGSHAIRLELLRVSTKLQCRDDDRTWKAIREDDEHIVSLLRDLLFTKDGQELVLSLRGAEAESLLNLLDKILIDGTYRSCFTTPSPQQSQAPHIILEGDRFRRKLHRISVRLSQYSDQLPTSIYVEGVRIADKHNLNGGAFADIFQGTYEGGTVAVKRLRMTLYQSPDQRAKTAKALCREALIWLHLEHPHVLPFLGIDRMSFPGSLCMLSPWMHHGNIHDFIKSTGFSEAEVYRLLYEIASGLAYLHRENIVHGDLRGPNILVDEFRRARVGDFGLANFGDSSTASVSAQGTGAIGWTAPELLNPDQFGLNNSRPTSESDVYAFGSVCWEIFTGKLPFQELHMVHALSKILQGKRPSRPTGDRTMKQGLWSCVKACWNHQPSSRPSSAKVEQFLQSYISDPSTFPEFGQINDHIPESGGFRWRSKTSRASHVTGVKNAPSPLSRLGVGSDSIEEETGGTPLAVRQILASENTRTGWSW